MDLELRHLRQLVAIADGGDLVSAARALRLAPTRLATQLVVIERRLGAPVFQPSDAGLVPTAQGRTVLRLARSVLEEVGALAGGLQDGQVSRLRLVGDDALLAPAVARLSELHPDLVVTVTAAEPAEAAEALRTGAADAAATIHWPHVHGDAANGLTVLDIAQHPMLLLLPAHHHLRGRPVVDLAEVRDEPWAARAGQAAESIVAECARHGVVADLRYQLGADETVLRYVAAGRAVTLVPQAPDDDAVFAVPYPEAAPARSLVMWPGAGGRPDLARDLVGALGEWHVQRARARVPSGAREGLLGTPERPVRFGTVAEHAGIALLPRLRTLHGLHATLRTASRAQLLAELEDDALDLVLLHRHPFLPEPVPPGWAQRTVAANEGLLVAVSVRNPISRSPVPLAALADESWVVQAPPSDEREVLEALCAEEGFSPRVMSAYEHPRDVVDIVASGLAVRLAAPHVTPLGSLLTPIEHPLAHRASVLVWHPERPATTVVDLVSEELRSAIRTEAAPASAAGTSLPG